MRTWLVAIVITAMFEGLFRSHAHATPPTYVESLPAIVGSGGLQSYAGSAASVNVLGYSAVGDGGGGQFVQGVAGCTDDGGVIIKDSASPARCWYRQFSGPVHLAWYGAKDATQAPCLTNRSASGCDSLFALNAAFLASKPSAGLGGDGGVVTDSRSIIINSANLTIPQFGYLDCGVAQGGFLQQTNMGTATTNVYYNNPGTIVLNPQYSMVLSGQGALRNCRGIPTWYLPQTTPFHIPYASTRDVIAGKQLYSGIFVKCIAEGCNINNLFVLGFDTCVEVANSPRTFLDHLALGCNVQVWGTSINGISTFANITGKEFLETRVLDSSGNNVAVESWPVSSALNDGTGQIAQAV